jgi:hypothetical protein
MTKSRKLTLYVNDEIIERAKKYADNQGTSVSDLVEQYLDEVSRKDNPVDDCDIRELPQSFSQFYGIISLPEDFDEKWETMEHRITKYS